jgi:hypothetical membrane protein
MSRRGPDALGWAEIAIAGIALYLALDVALVFLRPGLSVLHNAESDYGSKGRFDWVMDANFVIRCLLSLAAVRALSLTAANRGRLRFGLSLLVVWALCSGLLAFFPDDPVGTKTHGAGAVHVLLALIAFLGVLVGTIAVTRALRPDPRWRPVRVPLAVLAWGAIVPILLLGRVHLRPHSLGGLWEKVFLGVELAWLLLAAVWVARLQSLGGGRRSMIR